jgi:cobaltochelatase CobN
VRWFAGAGKRWRTKVLSAGIGIAVLAGVWLAWQQWLAPTRIALVNYPDFQAARIVKARPNAFVRVERVGVDRLDRLGGYDLALVFGRGLKLEDEQLERLRAAGRAGTAIYVDGATNPRFDVTSLQAEDRDAVTAYLRNGGGANYARLLNYARRVLDGKHLVSSAIERPKPMPQDVFFHLDEEALFENYADLERFLQQRPDWKANRQRVALVTSVPGPFNANRDHVDAVIRAFETRGFQVIPISAVSKRLAFLKEANPAAVVFLPHGRLAPGQADAARDWLAARNIPLFAPLTIFSEESEWLGDQRSYDGGLLTMSVTLPEQDGAIAPMAIAAQFRDADDFKVFRALPQRLDRFVSLVERTIALKSKANADKKLAIYYYKGPGQSAMTAGDLEVMPSLYQLLKRLKAAGYRVEGLPDSQDEFAKLLQRRGPNIGPYSKGDFTAFARYGEPATVSARELTEWCGRSLAQVLCDQVGKQYGPPPGDYLRLGDSVAVARVPLGNVVLLPQPLPGIEEDSFQLVHGTKLAPPWPYVASYLWTRNAFGADAIMHFGTHGSLEFTPWKQVGLSDQDWPDALIGELPHSYLYTMGNVGEAMIAKRRSYATTVSHLTPPFREGGAQSAYKQLADRLRAWEAAASPTLKAEYAKAVQHEAVAIKLNRDIGLPADAAWDEAQLLKLADHMETLEHAKITAGLYTLGSPYAPSDQRSSARLMGLDAIVRALADLDVARGVVRREQSDNPAWLARNYRPRAEGLIAAVERGIPASQVLDGVVTAAQMRHALAWELAQRKPRDRDIVHRPAGQSNVPAQGERLLGQAVLGLRDRLAAIPRYREQLAASPEAELAALTNALGGGFTPPSSGGDPIVNAAALPTGRNLISIDAEKTPSEQAWNVGVRMVDQLLAQHRAANGGAWPQKVAFTLWAGDFIHSEGTSIAQILYLLGVEPVRDPFGRVGGLRLIPRAQLGRPRVDVVVQTSGQLRDLAASRLALINKAVALAAGAREDDNAVAQGVRAVERQLKENGASPAEAQRFAAVRVYGGVNGNYGTGIMGMVEAGDRWQSDTELARTYLANMGAAFGEDDLWGAYQTGAFEAALAGTDVLVQPLESNTWGPISLDHVYEFMGGLNLAVREVTGNDPAAYFSDYRNASQPSMREAGAAIAVEARTTLLNPAYIEAMTQGGASSAETFAETFRNVYGWNVMKPSVIHPEVWDALHDTYVKDAQGLGVHQYFERTNPYALQEMTAVMLETARKGYWKPDDVRLREVAQLHARLVGRFGASGTEFVNNNQALRAFIGQQLAPVDRRPYEDALQRSNEGTTIAVDKGLVLRKDGSTAASSKPGAARDDARAPAKEMADAAWSQAALPAAAVLAVLMALAALVVWIRRNHARTGGS